MKYDVFISYSSKDKQTADAVCHALEENQIRCWMAPRDIPAGSDYGDIIDEAIVQCEIFLIIFSKESSVSPWVKGELNLAFTEQKKIFPYRIDETKMQGAIRVMLNQRHWIDAFPRPEEKFHDLVIAISNALGRPISSSTVINPKLSVDENHTEEEQLQQEQERLQKEKAELEKLRQQLAEQQRLEEERMKIQAEREKLDKLLAEKKQKEEAERKRQAEETEKKRQIELQRKEEEQLKGKRDANPNISQVFQIRGVSYEMIPVHGGTFWMGAQNKDRNGRNYDENAYDSESPVHQVTLSNYSIGKYPVTQALWKIVMGSNQSHFKGDKLPVENVSWNDVQEFIRKLNAQTGRTFRLPTEAEWEYAARGGNKSKGYKYSGSNALGNVAWDEDNSDDCTHAVGTKSPNELGIYDMSGNVWEWCRDWYNDYSIDNQRNPTGQVSGAGRVLRGGSWFSRAEYCRGAYRGSSAPDARGYSGGFRLALDE